MPMMDGIVDAVNRADGSKSEVYRDDDCDDVNDCEWMKDDRWIAVTGGGKVVLGSIEGRQ